MWPPEALFRAIALCSCLILAAGCTTRRKTTANLANDAPSRPDTQQLAKLDPAPTAEEADASPPPRSSAEPAAEQISPGAESYAPLTTAWGELHVVDLGPAASLTATPLGAVFVTRDDRIVIARKRGSHLDSVDLPPDAFSKYGFGPGVSKTHVYWSSQKGLLLRASLETLEVHSLFDRARPNTRTSVQTAFGRDVVAFVASIDERSFAYLWVSPGAGDAEILDASADGHDATSVTLIQGQPHPRLIVLEGRTSMSPVHARTVRVTARRALLEPNEVVWVGPGSHELTEIHAMATKPGDAIALLPTQRDFDAFGLARLRIAPNGGQAPEPTWQVYPNGLDPAPITAARFCNQDYVLFVRPSEQRPRSPQELHLAPLDSVTEGEILVRSRAFNDVSVAPVPEGALLAWTADRRSWGMILHCPR